jgi:3-hexulose-6-phosphate synthase/6-phospho-3-hexuloisomerase
MADKVITQVALDVVDGHRAIQIAREAIEGGIDWLEAGTALIKSEGMEIVRQLRHTFPQHDIVADMKTMDVGGVEVEIASKSGATIVCVMGVSEDQTITEALKSASQYGSKIMVDLLGVKDKPTRAKEMEELGADYVCVHVSIDEQMVGGNPLKELKAVAKAVQIPVAAAGGLNSETAPLAVKSGASIIIVGGAIIKARDVEKAARAVVKSLKDMKPVSSELYKKYDEDKLRLAFSKVSTPNIADAMHKKGSMHGLHPILNRNRKMIGQAVTVRTTDGDWAKPIEAIDKAKKGDVIVIDAGSGQIAVWGELASWSCKKKGVEGVVIDGAIRDVDAILDMDFPAFARSKRSAAGEPKGHGEIGCEIVCGGQTVQPGDWIVGDETGLVVIPKKHAVETANRALDVMERENRIREEIQRGSTLSKVLNVEKWEKK